LFWKSLQNYSLLLKKNLGTFLGWNRIVEEEPLRAELFSIEQFKVHAKNLAKVQAVS